ncbi:DUF1054 domain-containing protein [Bacillus sp. B15-48]|uniref:YktB family protein n=1 Tax=Bacillus sp. B15-48 TaxID=1548601 RepID=UPI00193EC8DB|nr:DUF1054 domain-containing protein [Bacillus sp. B15-48]MBM4764365.1 DUF1054 family protein [Bacillus sp. B15-48]
MNINGFTEDDFNVFTIDGLDERMEALKGNIRPKLESLGKYFTPELSTLTGDELFYHVAKHARRTKNPPNDTWVAFAANPRGYKMLPHFQIGLWETHLFVWFALIYEAPNKQEFGKLLEQNAERLFNETPNNFVWSMDHTKPDVFKQSELTQTELVSMFQRLQNVKKAEILCGYQIPREEAVKLSSTELLETFDSVLKTLVPLYKLGH